MSTPFKMKGYSYPGISPVKHRKDGKWTGHEHKTKLGKLTGRIAEGIKRYMEGKHAGHEFTPVDYIGISKKGGFQANISRPTSYTKDYGWKSSYKGDLFSTIKDTKTGKRTTKIFGHELKAPESMTGAERLKKQKERTKKFRTI